MFSGEDCFQFFKTLNHNYEYFANNSNNVNIDIYF